MTTNLQQTEENKIQQGSAGHNPFAGLTEQYPGYDLVPLLDLITCNTADAYEAFFNQVAEVICWHLQDDQWDSKYLMHMIHELFRFRDAFRNARGGAVWKAT